MTLSGQVAVITGGSGVLGKSMATALAGAGAKVVVLGRSLETAQKASAEIKGEVLPLACDVLSIESLEAVRQAIHAQFGSVDILVNSAGGNNPAASTSPERSFFQLDPVALQQVMNLNFLGTVQACQVFGRDMVERKQGNIINITSMAAIRPLTRVLGYGAAKAAVVNLTQWLAVHFAKEYGPGIRVNAIAPGFFLTEQNRYLLVKPEGELTPRAETIVAHTPMSRFGEAEELISTLMWLVNPASRFITGTIVPVDGGFSAFSGV